jgi:hypothetical protein
LSTRKVMSVLAGSAALVAALSVPALAGSEDLPAGPSSAPQSAAYNEPNVVSLPILGDDDDDKSDDKDESGKSGKGHESDDKGDHGKSDKDHSDKGDHGKSEKKPAPKPETVEGDLPVTH